MRCKQTIDRLARDAHQPRSAVSRSLLGQPIGMSCFKYNRVNFVATERLVLLGRCEFQHTFGTGSRPAIKSEDDIAGKVISNTSRANAHPLATQVLEIADAGIGTSDNGKCFRVQCGYHAELRIRTSSAEWPLTLERSQGDVGLRKAKR